MIAFPSVDTAETSPVPKSFTIGDTEYINAIPDYPFLGTTFSDQGDDFNVITRKAPTANRIAATPNMGTVFQDIICPTGINYIKTAGVTAGKFTAPSETKNQGGYTSYGCAGGDTTAVVMPQTPYRVATYDSAKKAWRIDCNGTQITSLTAFQGGIYSPVRYVYTCGNNASYPGVTSSGRASIIMNHYPNDASSSRSIPMAIAGYNTIDCTKKRIGSRLVSLDIHDPVKKTVDGMNNVPVMDVDYVCGVPAAYKTAADSADATIYADAGGVGGKIATSLDGKGNRVVRGFNFSPVYAKPDNNKAQAQAFHFVPDATAPAGAAKYGGVLYTPGLNNTTLGDRKSISPLFDSPNFSKPKSFTADCRGGSVDFAIGGFEMSTDVYPDYAYYRCATGTPMNPDTEVTRFVDAYSQDDEYDISVYPRLLGRAVCADDEAMTSFAASSGPYGARLYYTCAKPSLLEKKSS